LAPACKITDNNAVFIDMWKFANIIELPVFAEISVWILTGIVFHI